MLVRGTWCWEKQWRISVQRASGVKEVDVVCGGGFGGG